MSLSRPFTSRIPACAAPWRKPVFLTLAVITATLALLFPSLASSANEVESPEERSSMIPDRPLLVGGPWLEVFGTNLEFSAEIKIEHRYSHSAKPSSQKGILIRKGTKTLLQTQPESARQLRKGKATVVIAVAKTDEHASFVLYDALSAYAEIPNPPGWKGTYNTTSTPLSGSERHNGTQCSRRQITVISTNQILQIFTTCISPTTSIPLHIETKQGDRLYSITLSKIRLEPADDTLFLPPQGATRYANIESMTVELMGRLGSAFGNQKHFEGPVELPSNPRRGNPIAPDLPRR